LLAMLQIVLKSNVARVRHRNLVNHSSSSFDPARHRRRRRKLQHSKTFVRFGLLRKGPIQSAAMPEQNSAVAQRFHYTPEIRKYHAAGK
jgi:hypothetical protein